MSIARCGRKHSPETRAKMRAAALGRKFSPEHRANMKAARLCSEHRAKMSAARGSPAWYVEVVRLTHISERSRVRKMWHAWHKYALAPEDEALLYERQHNKCPVCGKFLRADSTYHIDHDKVTGRVRGLLHDRCNGNLLATVEHYGPAAEMYLAVTPVDLLLEQHGSRSSVV